MLNSEYVVTAVLASIAIGTPLVILVILFAVGMRHAARRCYRYHGCKPAKPLRRTWRG